MDSWFRKHKNDPVEKLHESKRIEGKEMSKVNSVVNKILEGGDVRAALSKKLNEEFSEEFRQEIVKNPINKKIKQIAAKYGYVAGETFLYWYGGIHCSVVPKDRGGYHPSVYIDSDIKDVKFRIQTTSYGAISLEDYSEFLKGCEAAYNMVKEINKLDLTKLAKEPKSDDEDFM